MMGRGAKWGQTGGSESDHIQPRRSWQGGSQLFSLTVVDEEKRYPLKSIHAAAAAAKSLHSCLTLCDPTDGSPQDPHPWDSPGKNTGVGCHFLLQCMKVKSESEVAQSCTTLIDPMDCSPPGSSVHGIFQARILEWGAIAFSERHVYFNTHTHTHTQKQSNKGKSHSIACSTFFSLLNSFKLHSTPKGDTTPLENWAQTQVGLTGQSYLIHSFTTWWIGHGVEP